MQKLISIPLLVFYLFVSIGIQGVSHYCGEDLVGIALFESADEMDCSGMACCNAPVPVDEDECCTDIQFNVFYESERSLALTTGNFELKAPEAPVLPFSSLIIEEDLELDLPSEQYHEPGELSTIPIYLQNQSLIFYG